VPQINVLTQQHILIDALSVSDELYKQLQFLFIASHQDFFTMASLAEFRAEFLEASILQYNLRDFTQSTIWNLDKANLHANRLYPWYRELLSFIDYLTLIPYPDCNLLIALIP
jgi:hypothetical protein